MAIVFSDCDNGPWGALQAGERGFRSIWWWAWDSGEDDLHSKKVPLGRYPWEVYEGRKWRCRWWAGLLPGKAPLFRDSGTAVSPVDPL